MIDRRSLLWGLGAGTAGLPASAALSRALAQGLEPLPATVSTLFFTQAERVFVRAAMDALIPPSDAGPSATEAGTDVYLDRALLATYGAGTGWYLEGPFGAGEPTQGYQLPLTPAELYHGGIEEVDAWAAAAHGTSFAELPAATVVDALALMQSNEMALATIPPALLFGTLWFDTQVGYFCDPIYGGNRDMAAWRMLGFPGAYSEMRRFVGQRTPVEIEPVSLQQFVGGN